MGDPESHESSSLLSRTVTRVRVFAALRLGVDDSKQGRMRLAAMAMAALVVVFLLTSGLASSEADSSAMAKRSFSDDDGEDAGGGGASSLAAGLESARKDDDEPMDDDGGDVPAKPKKKTRDVSAITPKQLKLFQDKDKTLMKFFSKLRRETEVAAHFQLLADTYKELNLIKTTVIGTTYEKRKVVAYTIGRGQSGRGLLITAEEKPNDQGLSAMAVAYLATRLVQKYALTPTVTEVVDELNIYLVPVVNPDGLAYTSSSKSHRDWTMNRALNPEKKHGVDVSADFEAMTQIESQAVRDFAKGRPVHAFVSVQCCAGEVVQDKAATCASHPDVAKSVVEKVAAGMGRLGPYSYPVSQSSQPASSVAYAFRELGVGLTMAVSAHTSNPVPTLIKTAELVTASQNVTMGILELAKYLSSDFKERGVLGGGGAKPCQAGGGASEAAADDDDDESAARTHGDAGDGEEDEAAEEEEKKSSSAGAAAAAAAGDEDAEERHDQAKEALPASAEDAESLGLSLQFAQHSLAAKLPASEVPESSTGVGDEYFLYFAYGPDMLYDVLLKAGLNTAWKVANAKLLGYTFDYTYHSSSRWKSGVADIVKSLHGVTYGVVYRLHVTQLAALKQWAMASSPASPLTMKSVEVVEMADAAIKHTCVTFYVTKKSKGEDIIGKYHRFNPSRQYRNCILKAAKAHRLPYEYQEKLKSRSLAPLFTDKVGSTGHRNPSIGTVCDSSSA